jgi:hypothetical protein
MASEFEAIKIVELDDKASQHMKMVLTLSASAPSEWSGDFNARWKQHFYMLKRRAEVCGRNLEVCCAPSELQEQVNELKKVIAETNTAYQAYLQERQTATALRDAEEARQQAEIVELKSKLRFD